MKNLSLVLSLFGGMLAATASSASIVLSLGSETISAGDTATVALDVSGLTPGVTSLGTFDVNIAFNSNVLSFATASFGDPVLGADQLDPEGYGTSSSITPGKGTVDLFELSLDDSAALLASQPANFTLATLTFHALTTGSSALSLSSNALGDQSGNSLTAELQNGSVNVSAVPLPAAGPLLFLGLGGLACLARKKRAV